MDELPERIRDLMQRSWAPVRVLMAAQDRLGPAILEPLYNALGSRYHPLHQPVERVTIEAALAEVGLSSDLAGVGETDTYDAALRESHRAGITTAGAAFGHVDLALAIVRASSPALSDLVARYLVVDERPSQAAYTIPSALAQSDPTVAAFERWTREHLAETFSLLDAAKAVGVSERTLQRLVQRTIGTSPIRFVQDLRGRTCRTPVAHHRTVYGDISHKVGYEHANTLACASPRAYRQDHRGPAQQVI